MFENIFVISFKYKESNLFLFNSLEKYNEQAAKIAEVLAGDVAVLPEGEVEDKALDILVIVGISSQ